MSTREAIMTSDELWDLPPDGMRRELVEGRLQVLTPAGFEHGQVASAIGALLFAHVRSANAGVTVGAETGFQLARDPDTVRAPDAAFVASERAAAVGRTQQYWPGAPDFAAEVLSPGDAFTEVEAKALAWLAAGTKAVLVADPQRRTATVYRDRDDVRVYDVDDTVDLSDAVPGWRLALNELFV